jgi:hypothetical protein
MKTETPQITCKFTPNNEYIKRFLNADNGLWDAMVGIKNGNYDLYKEYFTRITNGRICLNERINFLYDELKEPHNIMGAKQPRAMLHNNITGSGRSMNLDHSKFIEGDIFLIDGNHRITAAMIRGEEPTVLFDGWKSAPQHWKVVIEAKTSETYRIKHQPHPHPLLWDLKEYRTMESCKIRYGSLASIGIKSTYEIGCAEGVGIWILRQLGVNANGSEINPPSRTLAQSLIKDKIDTAATPEKLPQAECLILYSVLYHLLNNSLTRDAWINKIKEYPCAALELSTKEENEEKDRYRHMTEYDPLTWWPSRKLLYTDPKHANRETWLLWR